MESLVLFIYLLSAYSPAPQKDCGEACASLISQRNEAFLWRRCWDITVYGRNVMWFFFVVVWRDKELFKRDWPSLSNILDIGSVVDVLFFVLYTSGQVFGQICEALLRRLTLRI